MAPARFWSHADDLVGSSSIVIDRPKDSPHPRYTEFTYPLDYGYLKGTTSGDGEGIDVWVGSGPKTVVGLLCTVDLWKRDMEIKLLLGCSSEEIDRIQDFFTSLQLAFVVVLRDQAGIAC